MNRLTKTDSRRSKGVPRTAPSVHGADDGVRPPDDGVRRTGASPVGGWWPMSSPSEG